ncbi:voltage-dependent anion channel-domain-containing protein [Irpex rosettiformis]|uniref:Voltage-dependent anion channel-domain-containing protein n=1 Tax=Irpex rosettiformis TaxID=378272 RepID=A0ACB8UG11_9APHY|nr:voltage-dependent anion channel-domain-containing protein [Irpex rosettiformis]
MSKLQSDDSTATPPTPIKWKERIHLFSWQWHSVVMATGACSSLMHSFPYGTGSFVLQVMALMFFLLDLGLFLLLCVWAILRCTMFPEDRASILTNPAKSLFIGFFVNGIASLINAALTVNREWGTGSNYLLFTLWGLWWVDCVLSCIIAFALVYVMMGQNSRDLSKIGPVWMVPVITLIVASSSGGLFARAILPVSRTCAIISAGVSLSMLSIGLSLTMMLTTAFLLRLYLHGPLDANIVLTTFTTLTPLAQGGFSMLLNGQNLATLFPATSNPDTYLIGQLMFSTCICGAYFLWSMGLAWITIACFSIRQRLANLPRFSISSWCVIVPNGSYALLSLQLATVLQSEFFRVFGAVWACIVLGLWAGISARSIPAIIDGSMFKAASPATTGSSSTNNATTPSSPPVANDPQKPPIPTLPLASESVISVIEQLERPIKDDGRPTLSRPPSYATLYIPAQFQDLEAAVEKLVKEDDASDFMHFKRFR